MIITVVMITTYIIDCCLIRTRPCKYFQLNAPHFNTEKGIFSKIDLDQLFPEQWRLPQRYDSAEFMPQKFPVFLKPEWGQNAAGIYAAKNASELQQVREKLKQSTVPHILQQGASEHREFEIFSIRSVETPDRHSVFTVTEVTNSGQTLPINGIYNPTTEYRDITSQFTAKQLETLWELKGRVGRFTLSRLCVRADSIEQMLAGKFHIIELNLYNPFPLHMMDKKYTAYEKWKFARGYMIILARISKNLDKNQEWKHIYMNLKLYNRQTKFAQWLRRRL